jgi:hypothetical protein
VPATSWTVGELPGGYAERDTALNDMYEATVFGFQQAGWADAYGRRLSTDYHGYQHGLQPEPSPAPR